MALFYLSAATTGTHGNGVFRTVQRSSLAFQHDARREEDMKNHGTTTQARIRDLRQILMDRRREVDGDLRTRMRDGRSDRSEEVLDDGDSSDAALQNGIDFALIQMKTETLTRIDAALARLDAGLYGDCNDCGDEISDKRLRAMPFAVRCTACEAKLEQQTRTRRIAQNQAHLSLFAPM
jgi:DnaK suppressor protein